MIIPRQVASGKRKSAIAKAWIKEGTGKITINKVPYENLSSNFHVLMLREPIDIAKKVIGDFKYDVAITIKGGGVEGRIEAARLALAKSLVLFTRSPELKKALASYDKALLVADIRRKEPYKPGDSKARSKRQKSYR